MEKNTAHLLASSKFGRQAHGSQVCDVQRRKGVVAFQSHPQATVRYGDMKMTQPSHTPKPGSRWGQCTENTGGVGGGGERNTRETWDGLVGTIMMLWPNQEMQKSKLQVQWRPGGLKRPHPFIPEQPFPKALHCYFGEEHEEPQKPWRRFHLRHQSKS